MARAFLVAVPLGALLGVSGCATSATDSDAEVSEAQVTSGGAARSDTDGAAAEAAPWIDAEIRIEGEGGALLPAMPTAVTSFGAAVVDGHLYTLGGYAGEPHRYSREYQSVLLQRLPLDGSGGWASVGRIPRGLQGLELVGHDGRLCRVGGNHALNAEGEDTRMVSVTEAACFDVRAGEWTDLPPLPEGRSSHAAAVVGDTLFVVGGWTMDEGGPSEAGWARSVVSLDLSARPDAREWQRFEAPFARRALGAAAAGGKLVVVGGMDPEDGISARVDVYDPPSGSWSRGPDFPVDAFGIAAVGAGTKVYASGREGMLYVWDASGQGADAWQPVRRLAFKRFFHELVPAGEGLVAVGGIGGMHTFGRTRHVERLPLTAPEADPSGPAVVSTWTVAYPGAAKNRQGWFRRGDFLYAFGGNNSLGQHDFAPENFEAEGWRIHLPSARWQRVADYPVRRQSMVTVVVAGLGYAVGGFGHEGEAVDDAVTQDDVYRYDFESNAWTEVPGLSRGRTQFGLTATAEGDLWVFGGLHYDPARGGSAAFDHVVDVLRKPTAAEPPEPFAPVEGLVLPGPRRAFSGEKLGSRYYLIGGMREAFQLVDDCIAFDVDASAFETVACPRSGARLSGEMVAAGDGLVLVGGSVRTEEGMATERSVERYDPESDAWSVVVEELPFDPRHARALRWDDERVLVVSTHVEDPFARFALIDLGPR